MAETEPRWERVLELWQQGEMTEEDIAEELGMTAGQVRYDIHVRGAMRMTREATPGQALAELYASVYPDEERRNWIRRQFGVKADDNGH